MKEEELDNTHLDYIVCQVLRFYKGSITLKDIQKMSIINFFKLCRVTDKIVKDINRQQEAASKK